jgi:prepilin-type N-terminal cleavage/methylation domain-containing protein
MQKCQVFPKDLILEDRDDINNACGKPAVAQVGGVWKCREHIMEAAEALVNRPRVKAAGFTLLEMMVVLAIITIIVSIAAPNPQTVLQQLRQHQAYTETQQVQQLEVTAANCAANKQPCASINNLLPKPGTMTYQGYSFTFAQSDQFWSYTATPTNAGWVTYYTDAYNAPGMIQCGGPQGKPC